MFGAAPPKPAAEKTKVDVALEYYQKAADLVGLAMLPTILYFGWKASGKPNPLHIVSPI